ncbi:MAG: endolytic transglycosylase MltG [Rickettsiaceae bacterium]
MIKNLVTLKALVITGIIAIFITVNVFILCLFSPGPLESKKTIIIEQNLPISKISEKLYQEQIVQYPRLFTIVAKIYSIHKPMKSGEYLFTDHASIKQVLKTLVTGKSVVHKLIIPEGFTVQEIINQVNSEDRLLGKLNENIPEGFLLPSVYFFSYGDTKQQIVDQMHKKMTNALNSAMQKLLHKSLPINSRSEVLILASIVEKEAILDYERPTIAAVFLNRLKRNMKLQADPTVIYAITQGKYRLNRKLTKADLQIPSEFNTYYIKGLPATPISCPGIKSIDAVVEPDDTDALYFVLTQDNCSHSFSNNLNDHNKNVRQYNKK